MDLKQLEYIVTIAETGSITRASELLYITQPSLSLSLSRLEKSLGTKLFTRQKNQLVPTEAGELYIETAKQMLEMKNSLYKQLERLAQASQSLLVGISPLTCSQMFSFVYSQFKRIYPDISLELREASARSLEQMLLDQEINLSCSVYNKECHIQKHLTYVKMKKEYFRLGISRKHPAVHALSLSDKEIVSLADFKDIPFILSPSGTYRREIEEHSFKESGLNPLISCEVNNPFTTMRMIANNEGVAFFSDGFRDCEDRIMYLDIATKPYWIIGVVYSDNHILTDHEQRFIELVQQYYKNRATYL